jgi:hypothetical protein
MLRIRMLRGTKPADSANAFNAKDVLKYLAPNVER